MHDSRSSKPSARPRSGGEETETASGNAQQAQGRVSINFSALGRLHAMMDNPATLGDVVEDLKDGTPDGEPSKELVGLLVKAVGM